MHRHYQSHPFLPSLLILPVFSAVWQLVHPRPTQDLRLSRRSHHHQRLPDRSTVLPDEQGIMSAVYSNQYARFHPLLTFSLKLQVCSLFTLSFELNSNSLLARLPRTRINRALLDVPSCASPRPCRCWLPRCPYIISTLFPMSLPLARAPSRSRSACCAGQLRRRRVCCCFVGTRFTLHALVRTSKNIRCAPCASGRW